MEKSKITGEYKMDIFLKHKMVNRCINMILNITGEKIKYNVYSTDVINNINLLISALVTLNENIQPILLQNNNLADNIEEIAKHFEDIVHCYEQNESDEIKYIFIKQLTPKLRRFYKDLGRHISSKQKGTDEVTNYTK